MWTLFELHYTPKRYHFKRNWFVYTSHCSRKIPCTLAINIALHAAMESKDCWIGLKVNFSCFSATETLSQVNKANPHGNMVLKKGGS